MKLLFLTSFATQTLPLIDNYLPKPANQLKVAFIPTAADPYEDKSFVFVDRAALSNLGFKVTDVDIKNFKQKDLEFELAEFDVVFVAGGNTFYLLDQVKKSGFDEVIKKLINNGLIYIGSSAGSVLCCPSIDHVKVFDTPTVAPNLTNYAGLNLYPDLIIPHAQKEKYFERIKKIKEEAKLNRQNVVEISDNQVIVVTDNFSQVLEVRKKSTSINW